MGGRWAGGKEGAAWRVLLSAGSRNGGGGCGAWFLPAHSLPTSHSFNRSSRPAHPPPRAAAGGGSIGGSGGGGLKRTGGSGDDDGASVPSRGGPLAALAAGWAARSAADPSFGAKVLIEQVIGVGAAVLGDMSTRPFWGLHELDFVFSTLVVRCVWGGWVGGR